MLIQNIISFFRTIFHLVIYFSNPFLKKFTDFELYIKIMDFFQFQYFKKIFSFHLNLIEYTIVHEIYEHYDSNIGNIVFSKNNKYYFSKFKYHY